MSSVFYADFCKRLRPFARLCLRVDVLDGNLVLLCFQQVSPINFLLSAYGEEAELVFVKKIPQPRPTVIARAVSEFLGQNVVKLILPKCSVIVEGVGKSFIQFS